MPNNQLKTRLGKRLKALYQSIPGQTDHFLDLCCDHGSLGRAVLETRSDCHVTFNDLRPGIMNDLAELLQRYQAHNFTLDTGPAQQVQLPVQGQSTVMLAGIGDEQAIEIIESLLAQQTEQPCRLIISPATKVHYVRSFLASASVSLEQESLVTENRRTYEVISVRKALSGEKKPVSRFGSAWALGNTDHQQHLLKLIQFYDAQQNRNRTDDTALIVEHYKKILKKISSTT